VADNMENLNRLSSGVPGLDIVLSGGFFSGGIYLIQGNPGTGKTTIANQICFHGLRSGRKAIYVTLLAEYHARMAQYIGQMSFFDESKIPDQLTYISGFRVMRSEGLAALLTLIRREIVARKATILVVDGLIAAQRVAASEQAFNEFVHELQGLAIGANCTIFLVASAQGSGHTSPEHTMVDGILEFGDESFGWATERMLQVTKIRGSAYLRGKHSYKITDDGVLVYPRTEAVLAEPTAEDSPGAERTTSGIVELDVILHGGLPKSSTTMLLGPPGVGKTTFGLQYLSACNTNEPGLMLGFYERPTRIMAKALQICRPLLDLFENGIVEMLWQPSSNESLDAYAERLLATVRRRGVSRLFLDGLGALQSAPGALLRMQQFLPALTNELRAQGVTSIYSVEAVNNVGRATPASFGDMSLLAENLILLRYVERGPKLHRLLSILKVRDSDFDPLMHEFVLTNTGPKLMRSAQGAEAIMGDQAPDSI
jgi:circadian clock protein KaiC